MELPASDVEAQVDGVGKEPGRRSEVCLAHRDGPVTRILEDAGKGNFRFIHASHVPLGRLDMGQGAPRFIECGGGGVGPVGDAVTGGVLPVIRRCGPGEQTGRNRHS